MAEGPLLRKRRKDGTLQHNLAKAIVARRVNPVRSLPQVRLEDLTSSVVCRVGATAIDTISITHCQHSTELWWIPIPYTG